MGRPKLPDYRVDEQHSGWCNIYFRDERVQSAQKLLWALQVLAAVFWLMPPRQHLPLLFLCFFSIEIARMIIFLAAVPLLENPWSHWQFVGCEPNVEAARKRVEREKEERYKKTLGSRRKQIHYL